MTNAGAIRAGRAYVELFAEDSRLIAGLKRSERQLKAFGQAVTTIGSGLKTAGLWMAGLGAAIVAPLAMAAREFARTGDALVEMSQRTGMSIETLSGLALAASRSGVSMEEFEISVRRMQKTISGADDDSKAAVKALATLGLTVDGLAGKGTEEQFKAVADAIARISDPTDRAAAAMLMFGRAGTAMLPFLAGGRAGIEGFLVEARRMGLIISTEDAEAAHEFSHTLAELWATVKRGINIVGSALAPALQEGARWLITMARSAAQWIGEHKDLVVLAMKVGVGLVIAGGALAVFGKGIMILGGAFTVAAAAVRVFTTLAPLVAGAFSLLMLHPVVAVLVGLAAALTLAAIAFRVARVETVDLATSISELRAKSDELRQTDALRLERLQQLARCQTLTGDQMAEAQGIVAELTSRYGDLGIAVDDVAQRLIVAADAQTHLTAAMRQAAIAELDRELAELDANLSRVSAEMGKYQSGWRSALFLAVPEGLVNQAREIESKRWDILHRKAELGAGVEGAEFGQVKTDAERLRAAIAADASGNANAISSAADDEKEAIHNWHAQREATYQAIEAIRARADSLTEEVMTSEERAAAQLVEYNRLRAMIDPATGRSLLSDKTYSRLVVRLQGVDDAMAEMRKIGVAGGFGTEQAAGALGVGSMDKVAENTAKTATNTKKIIDVLADIGATFE